MEVFFRAINFVQVYIFITLCYYLFSIRKYTLQHIVILGILVVSLGTEVTNVWLRVHGYSRGLSSSLGIFLHHSLWIYFILRFLYASNRSTPLVLMGYTMFFVLNLFLGEGLLQFNFFTAMIGSIVYVSLFLLKSFHQLRREDLHFFRSNTYLFASAPILFFLGSSLLFSFKSAPVLQYDPFDAGISLHRIIMYTVNLVYFTFVNMYIYNEQK